MFCLNIRKYKNAIEKMILKPIYFYQSVAFYSHMIKNICFGCGFLTFCRED